MEGRSDLRVRVQDRDDDPDEYDSEWTSTEILVYAPRVWTRETHKHFSDRVRAEIRLFLLVNVRQGKRTLGRDLLQHLFQFVIADEPWAPVFRLHRYCFGSNFVHPAWALAKAKTPKAVREAGGVVAQFALIAEAGSEADGLAE